MSDERWVRVKALCQAAVERPVEERGIFVQHWFEELKRLVPTI